jgi:hypothetical protein
MLAHDLWWNRDGPGLFEGRAIALLGELTRATARVPTTPLHRSRPYNDHDSYERSERLLGSPGDGLEGGAWRRDDV